MNRFPRILLAFAGLFAGACTPGAPVCEPTTCAVAGRTCGALDDGCGHVLACGGCEAPAVCGPAGTCVPPACQDGCSEGATSCEGDAVRTCGRVDSGCLDWLPPVACGEGLVCSGGACAATCTDQCSEGMVQCNIASTRTCVRTNAGCLDWSAPVACGAGKACVNGVCAATCTDACTEGLSRCSAAGVETCQRVQTGCLAWVVEHACPSDATCVDGACVVTCLDRCAAQATRCGAGGVETCAVQPDGCLGWGAAVACPGATTCAGGACVASCTDACQEGTRRCGSAGVETCRREIGGCTAWDAAVPCGAHQACVDGACVTICVDACTAGVLRCNTTSPGVIDECRIQPTGCTAWAGGGACSSDQVCSRGSCAASCSDACALGAKRCAGAGIETCGTAPSGCTDWGDAVACPGAHDACVDGACVATCTDVCTIGMLRCNTTATGVEECRVQPGGCAGWSAAGACAGTEVCSGGTCAATCSDVCALGAKRCSGTGVETCVTAASGCTDWGAAAACPGAHDACVNGACVATCADTCTAGAKRCAGNGTQACVTQASGCTDWGTTTACPGPHDVCASGACAAMCADACALGAQRCSGTGIQTCTTQPSGCAGWGTTAACAGAHESCLNGACVATCADACALGAKRCSGTGIQTCTTQPSGCAGWGTTAACPGAHETCVTGACVATCTDQCTAGAQRCSGTSIQACAVQSTGCTAWGAPAACPGAQEVCSGGACVVSCTNQCTEGAQMCVAAGVATCRRQTTGCTDWDAPVDCSGAHEACTNGVCVATCSDVCSAGTTRCSGTSIQTCTTMSSGCTDWDASVTCPGAHEACSGGTCRATCTDACTAGTKRCGSAGVETCAVQQTGCTAWGAGVACTGAHEACSGAGNCVATCTDQCTAGATRCSGTNVQSCAVQQTGCTAWSAPAACAAANEACFGTACTRAYAIGGEVRGFGGPGLVLKNGSATYDVTAEGPFVFPARAADGTAYAVTVGTQPAWGVCAVANGSGTVAGADVTNVVVTCVPIVQPLYPSSGRSWCHFVQNDGPSPLLANDRACNPNSVSFGSCVHGGELRKVVVPGKSTCAGLAATDALGAFTWTCDASTNPVRVVSSGLAAGKGLTDLVDFTAVSWRSNAVTVTANGTALFTTAPAAWWTNPVVTLPLSKTSLTQAEGGKIYLVTATRHANFDTGLANGTALVTAPGVAIGGGTSSSSSGVTSAGSFNWFEGTYDGFGAESALHLLGTKFNVVHRATLSGGSGYGLELEQWFSVTVSANLVRDVTVGAGSQARTGVFITGGHGNVFERVTVTNGQSGVAEDATSSDDRFVDLDVRNNASYGAVLAGTRTAVRRFTAIGNANSGLVLDGPGASVVQATIAGQRWTGLEANGQDATIANVFVTANGYRQTRGGTPSRESSGLDVKGANSLVMNVATLNNYGTVGGLVLETGGAMTAADVLASEIRNDTSTSAVGAMTIWNTPGTKFTGLLKIGTYATTPCMISGSNGISSQCQPLAPSDATYSGPHVDAAGSFACLPAGSACEWSVVTADTIARGVLALPAATDTLTHAWKGGTTATFLRHAIELPNDGIGDEDGLCEAGEACLWTPNLGAYQGHGALVPAGTLANGITLWKYAVNGR